VREHTAQTPFNARLITFEWYLTKARPLTACVILTIFFFFFLKKIVLTKYI